MRKNCGFTLIELMILIAIVAIFVAILAPAFSGQRTSEQVRCSNAESSISSPVSDSWFLRDHSDLYISNRNQTFMPRSGDSCQIIEIKRNVSDAR